MANTFDWIEIRTDDAPALLSFYENVFGWRVQAKAAADGTAVWLFDTEGEPRTENLRRGGIWERPSGTAMGVVVYVLVENIEATLGRVVASGGRIIDPRTPQGSAFRATFADPAGNILALWEEPGGG